MTQIFMSTCAREPRYVLASLQSAFEQDSTCRKIHLQVDAVDDSFLGPWRDDPRVVVRCLTPQESAATEGEWTGVRVKLNMVRCLEAASCDEACIFLEDDVEFAPLWLQRAEAAAKNIISHLDSDASVVSSDTFVMSLYSAHAPKSTKDFAPYHLSDFFGNVALYFPAPILAKFSEFFCSEVRAGRQEAADILVKQVLEGNGVPLFMTRPPRRANSMAL